MTDEYIRIRLAPARPGSAKRYLPVEKFEEGNIYARLAASILKAACMNAGTGIRLHVYSWGTGMMSEHPPWYSREICYDEVFGRASYQ